MSANLRGFHTNVGELTHRFVRANNADIVFVSETFLDASVPANYARIKGYTGWIRKDRSTQGGGVAICYKASLSVVVLDTDIPPELEAVSVKVIGEGNRGTLLVGCYRPPSQGTALLAYLADNIDQLMAAHQCNNIIILGDLNPRGIQASFDSFLAVFGLQNHVTFPTHRSGSSLDPVVTDFSPHEVKCSPLGPVGSSDHEAILTRVEYRRDADESVTRTLWQWEDADWVGLRRCLAEQNWEGLLQGEVSQQVEGVTEALLEAQRRWVPHKQHKTKPTDQPWFGPQCRAASDAKYRAWRLYKRRPTQRNRDRHREAAAHMEATQDWARQQWADDKRRKLRGGHVGSKKWWGMVKDSQGDTKESVIPPLYTENGSVASTTQAKVDVLAQHFSRKMTVPEPEKPPPTPTMVAASKLSLVTTSEREVRAALSSLEETKAVGPDGLSPRLLRRCAAELAGPMNRLFNSILQQKTCPRMWKTSSVVPIHKKGSKSDPANYRPVSLLSVLGKVLEAVIAARLTNHLESQHLISDRQFGFRKGRSAADLNLLLSARWSDTLDQGRPTAALALDIAGAFDRVWHAALVERMRAFGVDGPLLQLLRDYLQERHLRVVHNGQQSSSHPIGAGVPQGSVLGPLLWNIYINDLLNLLPCAMAFADDITLTIGFSHGEEDTVTSSLNAILERIQAWGRRWQVSFAPHKTQLLVVSRTQHDIRPTFNGMPLTPQREMKVLGVTYDAKLTFRSHIEQLARTAAGQLASLRRITWLLDERGRELLYKAQIRSTLEYSCLAWGGAAPTHLATLDRVQRRAERLIWELHPEQQSTLLSLQHRRDVAGLTTLYKVQVVGDNHLQPLHQPKRCTGANTRSALATPSALTVPRSHSSHHQRQFLQTYVRWWNRFLASDYCPDDLSVAQCGVQRFKVKVNMWQRELRHRNHGGQR